MNNITVNSAKTIHFLQNNQQNEKEFTINFIDPFDKIAYTFMEDYGTFNSVSQTSHMTKTCCSQLFRYPDQVVLIKNLMANKKKGPLKVLDIGVAAGEEPLTHINSAFELSQNSAKTISDFLDLKTVDIQSHPPTHLPFKAAKLNSAVLNHLKNLYDTRSGKSFWKMPIENFVGKLIQAGDTQDVILFNNVIQHMAPKSNECLQTTLEQLADLVAPKGILCAELEDGLCETPETMRRFELMHKILKERNFTKIKEGIFQKN